MRRNKGIIKKNNKKKNRPGQNCQRDLKGGTNDLTSGWMPLKAQSMGHYRALLITDPTQFKSSPFPCGSTRLNYGYRGEATVCLRASFITAESTTTASCCLPCAGITAALPLLCSVILAVVTEGTPLSQLDTL